MFANNCEYMNILMKQGITAKNIQRNPKRDLVITKKILLNNKYDIVISFRKNVIIIFMNIRKFGGYTNGNVTKQSNSYWECRKRS